VVNGARKLKTKMRVKTLSLFFFASTLFAAETLKAESNEIAVRVQPNNIPLCVDIEKKILTFLLGMNSFNGSVSGDKLPVRHLFDVQCDTSGIYADWRLVDSKEDEFVVASTKVSDKESIDMTMDTLAFILVKQTMAKLPWDGEVTQVVRTKKSKTKFIKTLEKPKQAFFTAETSTGFASDAELGQCVPLEVVRYNFVKESVVPVGYGLILKAGKIDGQSEFVTGSSKSNEQRLFYRIIFGTSIPAWLKDSVDSCKEAAQEDREAGLKYANSDFELTQEDIIELRRIDQLGALMYGRLFTNNGIRGKTMIGGRVNNHLEIGRWGSVDMRAFRSVYSTPYESKNPLLSKSNPELTIGELYVLARLSVNGWNLELGPGAVIDKLNLSYFNKDEDLTSVAVEPSIRRTTLRSAFQVNGRYDWRDMFFNLRFSKSWSRISPVLSSDLSYGYQMTNTWSIGGGAYYLNLGDTIFGEPGATFVGVWGHLGITLRQKPD
jgi:hypothetical protein